ncbi:carbamoyltransferase C-terminal domain-containing protein [Xenorhabdus griffiniae]|uniref:carbamoyltransferase C-terminal domain-containing protein n=1 Tax=Xenorhabdus griffiniae TaxID=351672 RepID=UPI0030CCE13B
MENDRTSILLIDSAKKNQLSRLNDVSQQNNLHNHTAKIANVLSQMPFPWTTQVSLDLISASYLDAFEQGYSELRTHIYERFGICPIEAHAYSLPENEYITDIHTSLYTFNDKALAPYILASVGHDFGRQRFPGSCSETIGVGLLCHNGSIPGMTPLGWGNIEFLVKECDYSTYDEQGALTTTKGTSAAVVYLASLAGKLHSWLKRNQMIYDRHALHAAMICMSQAFQGRYLFDDVSEQEGMPQTWSVPLERSKEAKILLTLTPNSSVRNSQIALVVSYQASIARQTRLTTVVNGQEIVGQRGTLLIPAHLLEKPPLSITVYAVGRLDHVTVACQNTLVMKCISSQLLVAPDDEIIVGISASHDASACVMINGKIRYGIQLERLTRVKHDGNQSLNTTLAVDYCLDAAGLMREDVNCFAYNIQSVTPEYIGLNQPVCSTDFSLFDPFSPEAVVVSHHLCHAFAAWSGSKFSRGNVVVADGSGGCVVGQNDLLISGQEFSEYLNAGLKEHRPELHVVSHYTFCENGYTLLAREYSPSFNIRTGSRSLGEAYASVSQLVFNSWHASGKLMGLAPYGIPKFAEEIAIENPQGISFGYTWKQNFSKKTLNVMDYADLAASVQLVLEKGIFSRLEHYHITNNEPLVMTGGIALNSVVNYKVRQNFQLRDFYLFPAQHDAGISIGAANAAYYKRHNRILSDAFNHDYLGKVYGYEDIARALNLFADRVIVKPIDTVTLAERLHAGQIIGYYSCTKGSEFGPRALGARSILASPCSMDTWKFINRWVKFREDFRPFAPMVATEHLGRYFEGEGDYKYMLEVLPVRPEYREQLAAITHVDGSARVQTVSVNDNEEIHALLSAFGKLSGFPVLLNTSFNVRGKPIVERAEQAIEMLLSTHIDAVVFGDYIVELFAPSFSPEVVPGSLCLSPGCSLKSNLEKNQLRHIISHEYQGNNQIITASLYQALLLLVKQMSLVDTQAVYDELSPELRKAVIHYVRLKFLNVTRSFTEEFECDNLHH